MTKPSRDDESSAPVPTRPRDPPAASKEIPAGSGSEPDPDATDDPTAHLRNLATDQGTPPTPGQGLPLSGE